MCLQYKKEDVQMDTGSKGKLRKEKKRYDSKQELLLTKPKCWLLAIAAVIFAGSMAAVAVYNALRQPISGSGMSQSTMITGLIIYIMIAVGLFLLMRKLDNFISKWCSAFFVSLTVFFLALSIAFGLIMKFEPAFDLGAIYYGSIGMLEDGSCLAQLTRTSDINYFYYFPNNLGGLAANYLSLLVASIFGIKDYFAVFVVVNSIFAALSFLCIGLCIKKVFGKRQGVFAMLMAVLFPSYLFAAGTIYTDTMTMCFPILTLYLYIELVSAYSTKKKVIFTALFAIAACIGTLIKATVMIMPIAIILCDIIISFNKKTFVGLIRPISAALAAAIVLVGMSAALKGAFYATQLDREQAKKLETPKLHWVMMGLSGVGKYNFRDYEFTRSFSDPIERTEAVKGEIAKRIENLGIRGVLKLGAKKVSSLYEDGTFCETDFFSLSPAKITDLHRYAMTGGEYNDIYRSICNGEFYAIILIAAAGGAAAVAALRKRVISLVNGKTLITVAPMVAVIGLNLFIAGWEVSVRYSMNFLPVLLLSAAVSFCLAEEVFKKLRARGETKNQ